MSKLQRIEKNDSESKLLLAQELARAVEWDAPDGRRYRWDVEGILTQTFGHTWYHRGQIAQLVAGLGGTAVDTDYVLWCKPTPVDPPAS